MVLLLGLNLARVVSLYLIGLYAEAYFDLAHDELWAAVFVLATVLITFAWLGSRKPLLTTHATA